MAGSGAPGDGKNWEKGENEEQGRYSVEGEHIPAGDLVLVVDVGCNGRSRLGDRVTKDPRKVSAIIYPLLKICALVAGQ